MRLLVDGDEYLFKAAAALEHETQWDEQNVVLWSNCAEVWDQFNTSLKRLCERFHTDMTQVVLAFGSPPYFRTTLLDLSYKAGRPRKPICYAKLRKLCVEHFVVKSIPGLEADDVLGILGTQPIMNHDIVCSQDKDMQTLPISHWDGEGLVTYTLEQADYFHMFQTLTGDKTDGYPGCPGVGPVKAAKILNARISDPVKYLGMAKQEQWRRVIATYQKAGLTEEDALKQARLARILRWDDWDRAKKEPILWKPDAGLPDRLSA